MKTLLFVFLISMIVTYAFGLLDLVFLYVSALTFSALLFCGLVFLILTDLIWGLFHRDPEKSDPQKKLKFQITTFVCLFSGFAVVYSIKILRIQTHIRIKQVSIENLGALPYADWVPARNDSKKSGVSLYRPEICFPGLNLYAKKDQGEASLINMEGKVVHSWSDKRDNSDDWSAIKLCPNGGLLALEGNQNILRLDRDSNILWTKKIRCHHDIAMDDEGYIWTLIDKDRIVMPSVVPIPILDNSIVCLTKDGNILEEIPLYGILKPLIPEKTYWHVLLHIPLRYPGMIRSWFAEGFFFNTDMKLDIFHTNKVEILARDIEGVCKKGDILISVRELNTVVILDRHDQRIIWQWGSEELDRQHHPTLLENGNILLFDNGPSRDFSRVIEVNPLSKGLEWEFKAHPPEKFFSSTRGACQRLPNGNTLITESNRGRVFEVTRDGEMSWEFYTPIVSKREGLMRSTIYRMTRITDPEKFY
ncbi:MAG: arylsulfotransferase family protein [Candidatus Aminicenantes bacterium]